MTKEKFEAPGILGSDFPPINEQWTEGDKLQLRKVLDKSAQKQVESMGQNEATLWRINIRLYRIDQLQLLEGFPPLSYENEDSDTWIPSPGHHQVLNPS